ncbi:hypothetical protein ACHAPJ_010899 [Fusarium lateritium]
MSKAELERKDPYPVGSILCLNVTSDAQTTQDHPKRYVRVKRQFRPYTASCGLVVEMLDDTGQKEAGNDSKPRREAFLKLYDWRFAEELRKNNSTKQPWSKAIEHKYLTGLVSGKVQKFIYWLNDDGSSDESSRRSEDEWEPEEDEAYVYSKIIETYEAEVATYNRLGKYQGDVIPSFLGQVTLDISSENFTLNEQQRTFYHVKGILLEYLPGFNLKEIWEKAPRTSWQDIVDQAVRTVHILGDNDVLNPDVRPENFVVVPTEQEKYRVCMIDFGQCRFRGKDESDAEWGREKCQKGEEDAVGGHMQARLGQIYGFELNYEPSGRYSEWADRS